MGTQILSFAESLAPIAEIDVVDCRSDLFPYYGKRGYKEVKRIPVEEHIPPETLTRSGLKMVIMHKMKN